MNKNRTDVMVSGLDLNGLTTIINFERIIFSLFSIHENNDDWLSNFPTSRVTQLSRPDLNVLDVSSFLAAGESFNKVSSFIYWGNIFIGITGGGGGGGGGGM